MDRPRRIWTLILLMASVALGVGGIVLATLYRTGLRQQEARLVNIARSQARLLEAVARFDLEQSPDYPGGPMEATLSQFREASRRFAGMGETGEFTLARRVGDSVVFLLRQRAGEPEAPLALPLSGRLAEPQSRALNGESGTMIGPDYRGVQVLAAFEPVGMNDWGIVAKMDLAEIRAPFIRAGLLAGAAGALLVLLGSGLFLWVSEPLLARLRESEARHRTLAREMEAVFQASPLAMFVLDDHGRVARWNDAAEATFGWTEEEILHRELPIIPSEKKEEFHGLRETVLAGEGFTGLELRRRRKDGSPLDVRLSTAPVPDADGHATGIMAVMEDVTEEKAAEASLRESQERLDLALKGAELGFWDVRLPEGTWVYSRFLADLLGYGPEDLKATLEQWESLLHPEDRERAREGLDRHLSGETDLYSEEYRIRTRDGDYRWIRSRGRVMERGPESGSVRVLGTHMDITEERKARATEAQFRAVLDQIPLGFMLMEAPTGRVLHHNQQAEAILRHPVRPANSVEEYEGFGAHHADGTPFLPEEYPAARVLDSGEAVLNQIIRHRAGDGAEILLSLSAVPVLDDSGTMSAVVVLFEDVTEQTRAQRELRESEERYRRLAENSPDLIYRYRLSPEPGFEYVSPAATAITGYTPEDHYADPALGWKLVHPEDRSLMESLTREAAPSVFQEPLTLRWIRKDGTLVWTEQRNVPIRNDAGELVALEGIARDVTERMRMEEALQASEERYRSLFRNSHAVMLIIDPDSGRILDANPRAQEFYGYSLREFLDRTVFDLNALPETEVREALNDAEAKRRGYFRFPHRLADGTLRTVEVYSGPVQLPEGPRILSIIHDITDQARTETELVRQRELFQAVFHHAPVMMAVTNPKGEWLLANRAFRETLGWGLEEVREHPDILAELYPEEAERNRVLADIASGAGRWSDYKTRTRDGRVLDTTWANVRLADGSGLGIGQDITERKETQRELERTNTVLSRLLEVAGELSLARDTHEVTRIIRRAARALSGADGVTIVLREGESCFYVDEDAITPLWKGRRFPMRECISGWVMMNREEVAIEDIYADPRIPVDAYRETFVRSLAMAPIRGDEPIGAVGAYWADRHTPTQPERALLAALGEMAGTAWDALEARESLLASETKYRLLADNTLDVIWTMNMEMEFTYVNPAIRMLTDHAPDEWMGTRLCDHCDEKHCMEMMTLVRDTVAEGPNDQGIVFETEMLRKNGDPIPLEIHAKVFFHEDGSPVQLQGVTRNITERKRMERELQAWAAELESRVEERTEELAAANRELEAFSYTVSHDLKAPLRAIDGFSGILETDFGPTLDAEGRRVLEVVRSNTRQMAQLIDDLLAFSRLGRAEMRTRPVELGPLVEACLEDIPHEMEGREVDLTLEDLPTVRGDRLLLRQAMMNLLNNALKFSSDRKVSKIRVGSYPEGEEVVVFVQDNGVGFDPNYAHKLFGVFQRLHHADEFPGTGVGLANVRRIVERHGGRVWAQGEEGKGATIFMALPQNGEEA